MEFFATAANIPVHILDSKKGDTTILMLHGYLETMYIWEDMYQELSKDFRVIIADLPGHVLSCSAPVNSMEFIATVCKGILELCGVEKVYIAGHSLGGYAAIRSCIMYPSVFRGLILFNSHPYKESERLTELRQREIQVIGEGKMMVLADLSIPKMYCPSNLRRMDEKIRQTVELCETHDPSGIISSIKGLVAREDTSEYLSKAPIPVMAVFGADDNLVDTAVQIRFAADCPNVRIECLTECGHNSIVEYPTRCCELIRDFTKGNC